MFNPDKDRVTSLEDRLRQWVPDAAGLDRDRMLFEAGRAQALGSIRAESRARLWKLAAAAAVVLAVGSGFAWHNERNQRLALELALAGAPVTLPATVRSAPELMTEHPKREVADPSSYLVLVRQVTNQEDCAEPLPHATTPKAVANPRFADLPATTPLRPRDLNRVISL
jgi:hypothetical protein